MSFQAYASVKGSKQGQFKGESTKPDREDWMEVIAFTMGVVSPHDPATGQITGRRQLDPVTFVKQWGSASPQGLVACSTNEVLSTSTFEFVQTDALGEELVYQTVKLTNATISRILRGTGDPGEVLGSGSIPSGTETRAVERWTFIFSEIEVVDQAGNTIYSDGRSHRTTV
ncbi:MAG: type VI secretion system tube protein Hcp [Acidobacteriota bacterium]|nr:type VI secretion system tube protein Hcp [Acidobacteriota bacterium]